MGPQVRFLVLASMLASSALAMDPGDRVLVIWGNGKYEFPGRLTAVEGDQATVSYDDGTTETVPSHKVRPFDWAEGTAVSCRWKGGEKWYRGDILTITDPHLRVRYEDTEEEDTVTSLCRCQAAEPAEPDEPDEISPPGPEPGERGLEP